MAETQTTLRMVMPQWQGGDNPNAYFGSKLLAWLAPQSSWPTVEVPVTPFDGHPSEVENGIRHRKALLRQLDSATSLIEAYQPDRVVVFGGDCLIDQAPFAYLNERYDGKLGVLWIDAHPDIKTPAEYANAHTMVLGNLLGEGDEEFASRVKRPIEPSRVLFAGLRSDALTEQEQEVVDRLGLGIAHTEELETSSELILNWLQANDIRHLAIHLDLDVLNPRAFRSTFFGEPEPEIDPVEAFPAGSMSFTVLSRILKDVHKATNVVGLGIAEHLPWDAINLRDLMQGIPIISEQRQA